MLPINDDDDIQIKNNIDDTNIVASEGGKISKQKQTAREEEKPIPSVALSPRLDPLSKEEFLCPRTATLSTKATSLSTSSSSSTTTSDDDLKNPRLNWLFNTQEYLKTLSDLIQREGRSFRSNLEPQDVKTIKFARFLFHSCSVIPALLYYAGTVETPPKFPATISYTIRKGLPQKAQMILWISGWAYMFQVLKKRSSSLVQKFCKKMFLTGVWTTLIFRLGQGPISDVCHFLGATTYMLDHVLLLQILNTRRLYSRLFYGSFAVLAYSLSKVKAIEQITGLVMESSDLSPRQRERVLNKFPNDLRRSLFRWELMVMIFENLLFISFVQGMPSGLLEDKDDDDGDGDDDRHDEESNQNRVDR